MHIWLQENRDPPEGSSRAAARKREDAERRARVRATFDLASSGYDRSPLRFFRDGADGLVAFAEVEPRDRVLDIAAGTRWAALAAAVHAGPRGKVVCIDLPPGTIAKAREKARRRGLSNVRFRLGDAQHLPYDTGTCDVVLASRAIFFMPDPERAPREGHRALKPGGRLALSSQGKAAFQPMMGMYWNLLKRYGVRVPSASGLGFEKATECRRYLSAAGSRHIATKVVEFGYPLPNAKAWWTIVWNTALRGGFRRLDPKDRARFRREHTEEVESLRGEHGIRLRMPTILANRRKPERRR